MSKQVKAFIIIAVLLLLSGLHLTIYNQNINKSYKIIQLNREWERLRDSNRFLNYQVSKKESLGRIEKIAITKLNMEYPKNIKYLKEPSVTD